MTRKKHKNEPCQAYCTWAQCLLVVSAPQLLDPPNRMFFLALGLATLAHGTRSQVELGSLNLVQTYAARCTDVGKDPLAQGVEVKCCPGLKQRQRNGVVTCERMDAVPCRKEGDDPYMQSLGCCPGLQECKIPPSGAGGHSFCSESCIVPQEAFCLCIFDIDRTLTAKQGLADECPGTKELDLVDKAYGGGNATLSALAVAGIDKTFCKDCYLGLCSAGDGSGVKSEWDDYILNRIMRTTPQDHLTDKFPFLKDWSLGPIDKAHPLKSPYVLNQPQDEKPAAVEAIRQWYQMIFNFTITKASTHYFDDKAENVVRFNGLGIPAQEVSCASRAGDIGLCGASPEEIRASDQTLCEERPLQKQSKS